MKNTNYNGIQIKKSQFTTEIMNDIEKCVMGTGSLTCAAESAPAHIRAEFNRAGLPTSGFDAGWWIWSEEFKGNWAQIIYNNDIVLVIFPKKIATAYMKLHSCHHVG